MNNTDKNEIANIKQTLKEEEINTASRVQAIKESNIKTLKLIEFLELNNYDFDIEIENLDPYESNYTERKITIEF